MSPDPASTAERVASHLRSLDVDGQSWITGVSINGLLAEGSEESVRAAKSLVDRAVATQDDDGQLGYGPSYPIEVFSHGREYEASWELTVKKCMNTNNTTAIGHGVLDFYERTGDDRYLDAAAREYESLRSFDRTEDGGIPHHDPEVAGIKSLWIDSVYMMCPFFSRYGAAADDEDAYDEAVEQLLVHADHLRDPRTGLFRHIWVETPDHYPQGTFWARGNGWAAAAAVDVLERLPDAHPRRDELVDLFADHCETLLPLQDGSGFWHNLVDDTDTPLESSGTLMFAYAFARGIEQGILDESEYRQPAADALEAVTRVVDDEGAVRRIAGPPGGPEAPLTVTPYGQGWYLMAASALD
ncbi:glycoside hydrolase family 88 protein [Halopelagius longus]|uniref:Glycosyl hydrolase family 88 n=1 Tax=Halopelagius longus TaxID=1236180 RepID=A0A1H1G390_9EURY|nr:glycoside hydrolase family 88 protein [Halopelagius longus]RDI69874.1 glycosyl hydrolase family 88 [Halopelagius longus]SDR07613.1 unsaturated rhamnogalacturonyl hydrolase [Halopelagius longus]